MNNAIHREFLDFLSKSEEKWKSGDYLINVTYPVVRDDKLFLRALDDIYESLVSCITGILKLEYLYKRISLTIDSKKNLQIFLNKLGNRYGLDEKDREMVREIIFLGKKHKDADVEFSGKGKAYIFDSEFGKLELDLNKMKKFVSLGKKLLESANSNFKNIF